MPKTSTIHHGIKIDDYPLGARKQPYLSFIGRLAPIKGPHIAIEVARKTGIPLKIAGEVQPLFKEYFESQIKPQIDGHFIEYLGQADLATKNELLGNSMAMLFPIQWNEPFGLVMIEAMACGTPVIALPGGSVAEVVCEGVSGHVCENAEQMATRIRNLNIIPTVVRRYAKERFSVEVMVSKYIRLYRSILEPKTTLPLTEDATSSLVAEPGAAA